MKHDAALTYWNPKLPMEELLGLSDQLKRRLRSDGYRTAGKLDQCPKEQLRALGYSDHAREQIGKALRLQRQFTEDIADIFAAEGVTEKMAKAMQPYDLFSLQLSTAQLGYILRWQRDVAGRYGEKEMFCVADGRVFYCTRCPYRDERSNFCGVCYRKLLDDMKEGRQNGV